MPNSLYIYIYIFILKIYYYEYYIGRETRVRVFNYTFIVAVRDGRKYIKMTYSIPKCIYYEMCTELNVLEKHIVWIQTVIVVITRIRH